MKQKREQAKDDSSDELVDYPEVPSVSIFNNLQYFSYAGIFVVAAIAASVNDFATMWALPSAPEEMPIFVIRIVLFIEMVILSVRWIIATHHELEMWVYWLKNPFPTQEVYGAMLSLSVVLGLLVSLPHKIMFLAAIMTVYFLVNYWAQWLTNDHFRRALEVTRQGRISKTRSKVLEIMEYYWLKRPQLGRVTTLMFFSSIAFSFALAGAVQQEPQRHRFQLIAYIIFILNILVGEIVMVWWRHERDKVIRQATDTKKGAPHATHAR